MPHSAKPTRPSRAFGLQTKMLALVLAPLLLVTSALVTAAALQQRAATQESIAEQREQLIEARQDKVRSVVESTRSAIAPLIDDPTLSDAETRRRVYEALQRVRFDGSNYIFAYDYQGVSTVLGDNPQLVGRNQYDLQDADGRYIVRGMIDTGREGGGFYGYEWQHPETGELAPKTSYIIDLPRLGWVMGAGVYLSDIEQAMTRVGAEAAAELRTAVLYSVLLGLSIFAGVALVAVWLVRRVVRPIAGTAAAMRDIAQGRGDLTRRLSVASRDEVGELAEQFNAFVARMQATLVDVRRSVYQVHGAAGEMAQGSEELASRTEQAAANLQETSASMEEITATVTHSAEAAQQANQLASETVGVARQGGEAMTQVERTMDEISGSAAQIGEIITLIDGIAFQTNILALNASVEAARAGEHGRGFAVVAQEVRNLASRSADAARDIRGLIDTAVGHTRQGGEIVQRAGATMREIVDSVTRVTDVIAEISAGAREQSSGISQINTAVTEMDTMTQQNAALVQQTSSSAGAMREQAARLSALIDTFVLGDDDQHGASARREATPALADPRPAGVRRRPADDAASETPSDGPSDGEWEAF